MSALGLPSSNDAATISINTERIVDAVGESDASSPLLVRLLFACGFITMAMDLATALYKPPRGVLFDGHRLAYYLVLAVIFLAGLAEVSATFWLSRYGRARTFLKAILYASVVPLVAVTALGGFTVLLKG